MRESAEDHKMSYEQLEQKLINKIDQYGRKEKFTLLTIFALILMIAVFLLLPCFLRLPIEGEEQHSIIEIRTGARHADSGSIRLHETTTSDTTSILPPTPLYNSERSKVKRTKTNN